MEPLEPVDLVDPLDSVGILGQVEPQDLREQLDLWDR